MLQGPLWKRGWGLFPRGWAFPCSSSWLCRVKCREKYIGFSLAGLISQLKNKLRRGAVSS